MPTHGAYGLTVCSSPELPGLEQVASRLPIDVDLRWDGPHRVSTSLPKGQVLLQCETAERLWYVGTVNHGRRVLRFPGCCEFILDDGSIEVRAHSDPSVALELAQILASGALLAFVLALRGATVLHASAVEVDGRAIAVVGGSGRGKSTVAALACAGGLPLLTDDLLRIDLRSSGRPWAYAGARELRLRPGAVNLIDRMAPASVRRTIDGRFAVRPPASQQPGLPLVSIALPRPRRDLTRIAARRLPGIDAMTELLAAPRLLGWRWPTALRAQLTALGALVECVSVWEVAVPWGPPFAGGLEHELADVFRDLAVGGRTNQVSSRGRRSA